VERFLRSRGESVKKAAKHLRTVLSWRETVGAGTLISSHSPGAPASAPLLLLSFRNLWCLPGPDMNKRKLVLINAALLCSALLEQPPWPVLAAADTYGTVHF